MGTLTICFNDKSADEVEKVDGVIQSVPLSAIMPIISQLVRLRQDEVIDGLIISDVDIRVKISRKKGRKIKAGI